MPVVTTDADLIGTYVEQVELQGTGIKVSIAVETTVQMSLDDAIFVGAASTGNRLVVHGLVHAERDEGNSATSAINAVGAGTAITISETGFVSGFVGIESQGADARIVNQGLVIGAVAGGTGIIYSGTSAEIVNAGTVSGDTGVAFFASSGSLVNEKGGTIIGYDIGVLMLSPADGLTLRNFGEIETFGLGIAVEGGGTGDVVINSGFINGRIALHGGADVFDNRGGRLNGAFLGGAGDDTLITERNLSFVEGVGEGVDTVKATRNFTLGDNVEALILIGGFDSKGTGSAGDNEISGNSGDNRIKGMDGADLLGGGKGDDLLSGGADEDTFVMKKGWGRDTLSDYVDETDQIAILDVKGIEDFGDLEKHIEQKGADTLILLGRGDTLVLKGVDADLLEATDFSFTI
ncbi:calcium-binding protein [Rhizobium sp. LjRoot254]|uniref:calcium-binding protein n=1 Tax=Rhizobium sp. LjRoot254 TaxID=3342297 RepID=UPI003ECCBA32